MLSSVNHSRLLRERGKRSVQSRSPGRMSAIRWKREGGTEEGRDGGRDGKRREREKGEGKAEWEEEEHKQKMKRGNRL